MWPRLRGARASLTAHRLIEELMIQANVAAAETLEQTPHAADLPHPRYAEPGEGAGPGRFPGDARHPVEQGRGRRPPNASTSCWNRRAAGRTPRSSTRWCCAPRCRRIYDTDNIGHFGLNLAALRPLHLADPPLRRPGRAPRPDPRAGLGRRRPVGPRHRQAAATPPSTSPSPSAAPWRPSATPPTATSPPSSRTASARLHRAHHRRHPLRPVRAAEPRPAPTASCRSPASAASISSHDDRAHALVGERSGARWRLGREVEVRLTEATPITGGLLFEMLSEPGPSDPKAPRPRLGVRKRGGPPPGVRRGKRR